MKIVVLDYGIGNVKSIINAFRENDVDVILSRDEAVIQEADGLILPGVGAFSHGMDNLKKFGLERIISEYVKTEKPLLGICLGMQMLMEGSEEFGYSDGLGLIEGRVIKIPVEETQDVRLPHISWNEIRKKNIDWEDTILEGVEEDSDMYFVHTFVAWPKNQDEILTVTEYAGVEFCSSVKKGNVYGCQFHPEKSAAKGLSIINNFINICKKYQGCQN